MIMTKDNITNYLMRSLYKLTVRGVTNEG
jgi:hypothetical protein